MGCICLACEEVTDFGPVGQSSKQQMSENEQHSKCFILILTHDELIISGNEFLLHMF